MAFRGYGMRRRHSFARHGGRSKPARQWLPIPATTFHSLVTVTTAAQILAFEAPTVTPGTAVTADPPEDQVLDRVTGSLRVTLTGAGVWVASMLLVDRTWTPLGGEFATDADKRILWSKTYDSQTVSVLTGFTTATWGPGHMTVLATTQAIIEQPLEMTYIDIQPKVRLEDGKQLIFLVSEVSGAASFSLTADWLRILMHRAGRR